MIIQFLTPVEPIHAGGSIELPNFVILTGKNGSGKTRLFNGIKSGNFQATDKDENPISNIQYLTSKSLSVSNNTTVNPTELQAKYKALLAKITLSLRNPNQGLQFSSNDTVKVPEYRQVAQSILNDFKNEGKTEISYEEMVNLIEERRTNRSLFDDQFSAEFVKYFIKKRDNEINEFLATQKSQNVKFLTDEEFITQEGPPPWELINNVLESAEIPYSVTHPTDDKTPFVVQLKHTSNPHVVIGFSSLSSGEKTLCKLALAIYQSQRKAQFPELLLLDEPDAHLHPSMTKQLIDTLIESFSPHIKHGIIISTHSPSTCALSPAGSLYLMNKESRRPEPTQIDIALQQLCVGIPTLSIRKENERQIIVESSIDAEIYSSIWQRVKKYKKLENTPNLNFISSGKAWRTGSCEQAQDLCRKFCAGGSTSTFAIIDRDSDNVSEGSIFILGSGERYSIENFILHPLSLATLLIHHHGDKSPYGFLSDLTIIEFKELTEEQYQAISNNICALIAEKLGKFRENKKALDKKFPDIIIDEDHVNVEMISGLKQLIPNWYCQSNGHVLESLILAVFPELQSYGSTHEAGKLMTAVCIHVFAPFPHLIPAGISNTLVKLTK